METWIERQKNILDFTLSSLLRRKGKNLALLFVYSLVVFMLGSVLLFTHAIKREASLILQDAPEMIVQRSNAGGSWFDWQLYDRAVDAPTANHPVFRIDWNANGRIDAGDGGELLFERCCNRRSHRLGRCARKIRGHLDRGEVHVGQVRDR